MSNATADSTETECVQAALANARAMGLRYVDDGSPGITRKPGKDGFVYFDHKGDRISDADELSRIKSLAVPPAWSNVWICRWAHGHIQATGRDAKGRKQYRYHMQWRAVRDEVKYGRMLQFGQTLPAMREKIHKALSLPGLPREKVLAAIVYLLQTTMMRVGNREYARSNDSFGMTTLRKKHVRVDGTQIQFEFRGKSGVQHSIKMQDRRLARIIQRTRELPGQDLFQYVDENGDRHALGSSDVNDYLREISGDDYTAKDVRTWSGTMLAAVVLSDFAQAESETQARKNITHAIELVAKKLGNTPAICRKCYVHPGVLDAYVDGSLHVIAAKAKRDNKHDENIPSLELYESIVLALLETLVKPVQASKQSKATKKSLVDQPRQAGELKPKSKSESTLAKRVVAKLKTAVKAASKEKKPAGLLAAG